MSYRCHDWAVAHMKKPEVEITFLTILKGWIKGDSVMAPHFFVRDDMGPTASARLAGEIYFDCYSISYAVGTRRPQRELVAEISIDNKIDIVFANHVFYKFQAIHPLFFQKLRGHLYDMHNRSPYSCKEYLR